MRSVLLFLLLVASAAHADGRSDRAIRVADALSDAIASGTPADGAATLAPGLRYAGIAFRDRACAKQFPESGTVRKADLARFSTCLPSMEGMQSLWWIVGLTTDKPAPQKANAELTLGEMHATVDVRTWKIVRLEHRSARDQNGEEDGIEGGVEDGVVEGPPPPPEPRTVSMADIIAHLRTGSTVVPPDATTRDALRAAKQPGASFHLFVCFGGNGNAIHARAVGTSGYPRWNVAVEKAAMALAIKPFDGAPAGQTVCADITFTTDTRKNLMRAMLRE
jgi:hypothetical protein